MDNKTLTIPKPRKSVEIINELLQLHVNSSLNNIPLPNAASTATKRGFDSLMDPYMLPDNYLCKNLTKSDCIPQDESSLGLLDIDRDSEAASLITKTIKEFKTLSFHPQEMSGRSTYLCNSSESKDNKKYSMSSLNTKMCIEDILRDADEQSEAVNEILKSSDNPNVANIRMSLNNYKRRISDTTSKVKNDSWNFRPEDFGINNIEEGGSEMRDSSFTPASKIDMSKEEQSWLREHGVLPIHPTSATFTSASDKNTSNKFPNSTCEDFTSLRSNITNISKMSVGNYFKGRSENIDYILSAPSPEKIGPFPPLFDPEDDSSICEEKRKPTNVPNKVVKTFKKSQAAKSLPFQTLSDDSALSDRELDQPTANDDVAILTHVNNMQTSKYSNICKDITNSVIDDTTCGSPISCSQIKNLIENYGVEKKTILLENLLAQTKKKEVKNIREISNNNFKKAIKEKCENEVCSHNLEIKIDDKSLSKSKIGSSMQNISPTLPEKSSFGHVSNFFHSTKHEEELCNSKKLENELPATKYIPEKENQDNHRISSKFETPQVINNFSNDDYSSDLISTLKNYGKSHSGSSGFTESSMKSAATVLQVKIPNQLMPIRETVDVNLLSSSVDNKHISNASVKHTVHEATSSDASKEILKIMSPLSSKNNESSISAQNSSRAIAFDKDHFPSDFKRINLSEQCVPSDTLYKSDKLNSTCFTSQHLQSELAEFSLNVPISGDWISVKSIDESVIIGTLHDINLTLTSLSGRWVSVQFAVNSVHVNDQPCSVEDISNVILLQAPAAPLLLKADSQIICNLQATALLPNLLLKIYLTVILEDMVTKTESTVNHEIVLKTIEPNMKFACDYMKSGIIRFPSLPPGITTYIPLIIFNDSESDLHLRLNISSPHKEVFSIGSMTILPRGDSSKNLQCDIEKKTFRNESKQSQENNLTNMEQFLLPKDKSICFKILLHYKAPQLSNLEESNRVNYVDGKLNITTVSQANDEILTPLKKFSMIGGVGLSKLVFHQKQGSNSFIIVQGRSEEIWVSNCGTLDSHYKLFITDFDENQMNSKPSHNPMFALDKTEVNLKAGEKVSVSVTYPITDEHICGEIHRKLVFASIFGIDYCYIIGVAATRSVSQQSIYSLDSAASQVQDISIKSTKKELSWGSLKLDSSQIKEVALKNTSNKKIRIVATITEESFKLLGESGPTSSLSFSLLPQECKSLRVEFHPCRPGWFAGSIKMFHKTKSSVNVLCKVLLHGVGDVSMLVFKDGVFKHGGSQGLPLGSLSESGNTKDIQFSIWNKGMASAFVLFNLELKWKYRALRDDIKIVPEYGVISGNTIMRCVVKVPRKALLLASGQIGDTETLAALTILHGDDSTRQRIKRICSENCIDETIKDKRNKESQGKLDSLCMHFPEEDQTNESVMNQFKESPAVLKFLLDELQQKEVLLTYDLDLDSTAVRVSSEYDETVQFHTMSIDDTTQNISTDI